MTSRRSATSRNTEALETIAPELSERATASTARTHGQSEQNAQLIQVESVFYLGSVRTARCLQTALVSMGDRLKRDRLSRGHNVCLVWSGRRPRIVGEAEAEEEEETEVAEEAEGAEEGAEAEGAEAEVAAEEVEAAVEPEPEEQEEEEAEATAASSEEEEETEPETDAPVQEKAAETEGDEEQAEEEEEEAEAEAEAEDAERRLSEWCDAEREILTLA